MTFAQVLQSPEKTPRKEITPRIIVILFFLYAYNTLFGYVSLCFTDVAPPTKKKIFILKAKSQQMCRNLLEIINLSPQVHFLDAAAHIHLKALLAENCMESEHMYSMYLLNVLSK